MVAQKDLVNLKYLQVKFYKQFQYKYTALFSQICHFCENFILQVSYCF